MISRIATSLFFGFGRLYSIFLAFALVRFVTAALEARLPLQETPSVFMARILDEPAAGYARALLITNLQDASFELVLLIVSLLLGVLAVTRLIFPKGKASSPKFGLGDAVAGVLPFALPTVIRGHAGSWQIFPADAKAIGPAIVVCDGWTALIVAEEGRFARAIGPGINKLKKKESVYTSVDLRAQSVRRKVTAHTRDGLTVNAELGVTLEVQRPSSWRPDSGEFQFEEAALFKLAYHEQADKLGEAAKGTPHSPAWCWLEAVESIAVSALVGQIARHTLDQLLMAHDPRMTTSRWLGEEVKSIAAPEAAEYGARIRAVSVGNLILSPSLTASRIKSWQMIWESRQSVTEARMTTEKRQMHDAARGLAAREMIGSLSREFDKHPNSDAPDLVLMRLLQAMEKMAQEPKTQERIPVEDLEALKRFLTDKPGGAR